MKFNEIQWNEMKSHEMKKCNKIEVNEIWQNIMKSNKNEWDWMKCNGIE